MVAPTASLVAHKRFDFRVDPYSINWGYNLRTHNDDTYGGKVVQILGTELTTLSITTVAGAGGIDYVNSLMKFFRDMCLWQQDTQNLATFSYPFKNYFLNVWGLTISYSDQVGNVVYPVSMTFNIQDDINKELSKVAMTAELSRLVEGVGYTKSIYNYPTPNAINYFNSSLDRLNTMPDASNPATDPTNITATGVDKSLTPEKQSNAAAIIGVALSRGLGIPGAVVGIMTALAESSLINVDHGDVMGPSSIGLFQQMPSWGPNRTDPASAAGYFYDRLVSITPTWTSLPTWIACQRVEESEFVAGYSGEGSDGTEGWNYKQQVASAQSIVANIATAPAGSSSGVITNGVNITIPIGHPTSDIPPEVAGKIVVAPNGAVAKGIAAGFRAIGLPYIVGGGDGLGGNADGGSRGGNANATPIGFDCSGLTGYVIGQMGFTIGGSYTVPQKAGGTHIPYANAVCGDLLTYPANGDVSHITIYLGMINGQGPYLLEAPQSGQNVQIKLVYDSDGGHDANVERYWR